MTHKDLSEFFGVKQADICSPINTIMRCLESLGSSFVALFAINVRYLQQEDFPMEATGAIELGLLFGLLKRVEV